MKSSAPRDLKRTYTLRSTPNTTNTKQINVATHSGARWSSGVSCASGGDIVEFVAIVVDIPGVVESWRPATRQVRKRAVATSASSSGPTRPLWTFTSAFQRPPCCPDAEFLGSSLDGNFGKGSSAMGKDRKLVANHFCNYPSRVSARSRSAWWSLSSAPGLCEILCM